MQHDISKIAVFEQDTDNPWIDDDIQNALKDKFTLGVIVGSQDEVYGYAIYKIDKDDQAIRILRFLISKQQRRKKYGTELWGFIRNKLKSGKYTHLYIDVPEDSLDVHLFLKAMGFKAYNVVRDKFCSTYQFKYINTNIMS